MLGFLSNLHLVTEKLSSVCLPLSAALGQEQQSLNSVIRDDLLFQKAGERGSLCRRKCVMLLRT